jgi:hypothetical protein
MLSATQKARRNIKLLEEADHDAINKVGEAKFKKILTEQEKQLHHYLAQYTDPNYLPKGITKEYEFPKYFYYTVNSKKNGIVQKRTRTDSAMFKRFMKNKSKKEQAKAQGIFKITDEPIKININVPSTKKKNPKNPIPSYAVERPQYENTGDIRLQIHEILEVFKEIHPELDEDELLREIEDALEEEKKTNANKIKNMKFENLIEGIPSHAPKKKDIIITKKKKARQNDNIELDMTNNYTILGLSEDANEGEIKSAYKKLVRKLHPDKTGGDKELAKKFIIVDTAYKKLISELSEQNEEDLQHREFVMEVFRDTEQKKAMTRANINKLLRELQIEKSTAKKKKIQKEMYELLAQERAFENILQDCRAELSK